MVKQLENERFGKLVAVKPVGKSPRGHILWECHCDCGVIKNLPTSSIRAKGVKSCGCLSREQTSARSLTHGLSRANDPTYKVWIQMRRRCREKHRYADRGITVCERWLKFENFLSDMGERPDGLQLDRIDNDKGYSPENCRWTTPMENSNNRSNTHIINHDGVTRTAAQWSRELDVNRQTVIYRYQHGRDIQTGLPTR